MRIMMLALAVLMIIGSPAQAQETTEGGSAKWLENQLASPPCDSLAAADSLATIYANECVLQRAPADTSTLQIVPPNETAAIGPSHKTEVDAWTDLTEFPREVRRSLSDILSRLQRAADRANAATPDMGSNDVWARIEAWKLRQVRDSERESQAERSTAEAASAPGMEGRSLKLRSETETTQDPPLPGSSSLSAFGVELPERKIDLTTWPITEDTLLRQVEMWRAEQEAHPAAGLEAHNPTEVQTPELQQNTSTKAMKTDPAISRDGTAAEKHLRPVPSDLTLGSHDFRTCTETLRTLGERLHNLLRQAEQAAFDAAAAPVDPEFRKNLAGVIHQALKGLWCLEVDQVGGE
jgi:hypothetical protein